MNDLIINPGEVICDKCSGEGFIVKENINDDGNEYFFTTFNVTCEKCYGAGKLDWIEAIVGKEKPKPSEYTFNIKDFEKEYQCDFSNNITKNMANELAKKIDKQILDMIINNCEVKDEPKYIVKPWRFDMS